MRRWRVWCGGALLLAASGCSGPASLSPSSTSTPAPAATGPERYVTVGFWQDPTCSGDPVSTNRFPVHYGDAKR